MRKLGVLLVAGVLLFSAASCTTKKNEDVSAGASSTEATDNDNGAETSTTHKSTSTTESATDSSGDPDLGDCVAISAAVASLTIGAAFATDDQKAELQQQLDEMKAKVPSEIQDDVDTIAEGLDNADGLVEVGEFADSDEYRDAMANIQQYLSDNCDASDILPD